MTQDTSVCLMRNNEILVAIEVELFEALAGGFTQGVSGIDFLMYTREK